MTQKKADSNGADIRIKVGFFEHHKTKKLQLKIRRALAAAAGPGQFANGEAPFDNFGFSGRWLRENGFDPKMLSALTVEGDSMEPLLRHGDEILVDRGSRFERDGVHVVRLGEALMVKRLASAGAGRIALLSQNLAYPPVEVSLDEVEVLGRVVWKSGRL